MENTPENLLKDYVKSQNFSSTSQIMGAMKNMFKDVLEQVMECELEENLGFEKSQRVADCADSCTQKNYRNGYSKKTVKTQLGELEVNIPRDRNGNYTPQIIPKYSRNADGMEDKILALYACICQLKNPPPTQLKSPPPKKGILRFPSMIWFL